MADQRFHLNPKTGNPNICRAQPGNCPYGPVPHYGSKDEAREAYEASQESELLNSAVQREVELDEHGYLTEEFEALAAPSGVQCPHCGAPTSAREAASLIGNDFVSCHSCGKRYDLIEAKIELTPENSSHRFLQDEEVLAATWYHATNLENWLEEIDGDPNEFEVHVGTESAAFDRAITEYASHSDWGRSFYLYELRLAPDSSLQAGVEDDENGKLLEGGDADVVRYLNRWEDMASISLAVRPGKVVVGTRREVSVDEAHRRLTPYNIAPENLRDEPDADSEEESLADYLENDRIRRLEELEEKIKEEQELASMDRASEIFERAMERLLSRKPEED